jgi:hypothetical protein
MPAGRIGFALYSRLFVRDCGFKQRLAGPGSLPGRILDFSPVF